MKALIRDRYGLPDVLEVREVERPVPKEREVLVRVMVFGSEPGKTNQNQSTRGSLTLHLSGRGLNFHLGRDGQTGRPFQAWRSLPRICG